MPAANSLTYSVEAYNLSHASENKIHDDTVAKKLGFSGGLVPGVEVFAYATHLPLRHFGRAFLERGIMSCRFAKPVYDGHRAMVSATENAGSLVLKVESEGELCATGQAELPANAASAPVLEAYPALPPPTVRPEADESSLAVGRLLSTVPTVLDQGRHDTYLADVREADPIYAREGIVHPGILLRLCNSALRENVVLAPWIHVGTTMRNFGIARVGDRLSARTRVIANYDKKGHRLIDLDCLIVANGDTPVAHVAHTAIYRLRHLTE